MTELIIVKNLLKEQIAKVKELEEQLARLKFIHRIDASPIQPNHSMKVDDKDFNI